MRSVSCINSCLISKSSLTLIAIWSGHPTLKQGAPQAKKDRRGRCNQSTDSSFSPVPSQPTFTKNSVATKQGQQGRVTLPRAACELQRSPARNPAPSTQPSRLSTLVSTGPRLSAMHGPHKRGGTVTGELNQHSSEAAGPCDCSLNKCLLRT